MYEYGMDLIVNNHQTSIQDAGESDSELCHSGPEIWSAQCRTETIILNPLSHCALKRHNFLKHNT